MKLLKRKKPATSRKDDAPALKEPGLPLQIANQYLRLIILLTVVVALWIGYSVSIADQVADLKSVAQESLPTKEKVLRDLMAIKEDLDSVVVEFDLIKESRQETLNRVQLMVPTSSEYETLFTVFDDLTRASGLSMQNISIALGSRGASLSPEFVSSDGSPASALQLIQSLDALTINLSVRGGDYESFKRYLERLENHIRLLDVRSLSFSGGAFEVDENGVPGIPSFSIELVTYYQSS